MAQIDEHLIQPSTQLNALDIIDAHMDNKLPQLARECYFAEATVKPSPHNLCPSLWTNVSCTLNPCEEKHLTLLENKVGEME